MALQRPVIWSPGGYHDPVVAGDRAIISREDTGQVVLSRLL
jgi:hypothetical protein